MSKIIAMFNLRPGVSAAEYEAWARTEDLPTARGLRSIADFRVYRAGAVLGSDAPSPFAYFEILEVSDLALLGEEAGSEAMGKVVARFHELADNPQLVLVEDIESGEASDGRA